MSISPLLIKNKQTKKDDYFLALLRPTQEQGNASANSKHKRAYGTALIGLNKRLIKVPRLKLVSIQLVHANAELSHPCLDQSTWI